MALVLASWLRGSLGKNYWRDLLRALWGCVSCFQSLYEMYNCNLNTVKHTLRILLAELMVYYFIVSKTFFVCVVTELALVLWQWVFCCGVLPDHNHVLKCSLLIPCRGKGDYFRLGHGSDVHVRKPQVVEGLRGKKIVHVAVGALHCLAVTDAGQVRELETRSYVHSVACDKMCSLVLGKSEGWAASTVFLCTFA